MTIRLVEGNIVGYQTSALPPEGTFYVTPGERIQ
jgi:hypothetical protein